LGGSRGCGGSPSRNVIHTNDIEEENLMNAEALIGTTLGTCVLQKVIGQGGMGAVYLAQQSRPRRQVAVKVLLPATPLSPNQRVAFLERFRRETDAAASLEHPNIVPVYEYGERDGLAYLVMPYISGGTLRDIMEVQDKLPLAQIMHYLEQLAAALDFAHERGVIHRDIKPANILLTPEGRVLLTDFGLVKIIADGQTPQMRLTGAGAPVGTPDYMSPEQVIGEKVDGRADLYSLGILVYQMITGLTPYQGETPMQIAAQHLQASPPTPRILRPDLPVSAEQALLHALSKRPADRYARCQDFADAFQASLVTAGILSGPLSSTANYPALGKSATASRLSAYIPMPGMLPSTVSHEGHATFPLPTRATGLLSRAGMAPKGATGQMPTAPANNGPVLDAASTPQQPAVLPSAHRPLFLPKATRTLPAFGGSQPLVEPQPMQDSQQALLPKATMALPPITGEQPGLPTPPMRQLSPALPPRVTGALPVPGSPMGVANGINATNAANTIKLTGPVKVVQMPIAGQPGHYMTGLLPVIPQTPDPDALSTTQNALKKPWKTLVIAALVLLIVFSAVASYLVLRSHQLPTTSTGNNTVKVSGTPNLAATATANVQATAQSNLILSDPLSQNINNWPVSANEIFEDGAYHIYNSDNSAIAVVLPQQSFNMPNTYSMTMWEVRGNDTSNNNSFGLIIRFSQQTKSGKVYTSFYSFEVVNIAGGEYRFYKYDDSQSNRWTELWHKSFGTEYHQGQGQSKTNTIAVTSNGSNFTFVVNGKVVGSTQDKSLTTGTLGMLVNLKGTEVAFMNLLVTRN
jgi:serine/threonine protein kinase